jgi:hypothetical protein
MERFIICMLIGALLYGLGYLRMRPSRPSWTVLALLAGVVIFAFLLGDPSPTLALVLPGIFTGVLLGAFLHTALAPAPAPTIELRPSTEKTGVIAYQRGRELALVPYEWTTVGLPRIELRMDRAQWVAPTAEPLSAKQHSSIADQLRTWATARSLLLTIVGSSSANDVA